MTTTTHPTDTEAHAQTTRDWRVRVAVRVPRDGTADLATNACQRLERPTGVEAVEDIRLTGLEPALAATNAHLDVHVVTACGMAAPDVEDLINSAPGVERVEAVREVC